MSNAVIHKGAVLLRRIAGLDYADDAALTPEQSGCLRNMYLNGIYSNFSDGAAGNYTSLFMVALRATDVQIGFLATMVQVLAALSPLPGAYLAEKTHAYRATILWPSVTARVGYLLLVLLPFFLIGQPAIALAILIFVMRSFLISLVGAPWTAAMGQMVPIRLRAAYFSARNFAGGIAVIAGTMLAGVIITSLGFPSGYQAVFLIAGLMGFAASYIYSRVPRSAYGSLEARGKQSQTGTGRLTLATILSQKPFIRFMLCSCALSFAVNLGGPFIALYQVRELHFTAATIGLLVSIELAVNIIMQRVYGSVLIPRFGDYRVMRALRLATAIVPLAWMFVTDPLAGALVGMVAGVVWSGHDLANFNGLLEITPETGRASYIAIHTVTTSLSAAIGPLIGGLLTSVIGYHPLFFASGILRFLAGVLLIVLVTDWAVTRKIPASHKAEPG